MRSAQNVVAELVHVKAQGPLHVIGFRESIFVYSAEWLREFGELYRREIRLPYYCHVRGDMMTQEMVDLLAWSGCHKVNLDIETANEELANGVLRRQIKMTRLIDGIRRLKRAGIVVFADNILGIPSGSLADDLATLQLNIDLDVEYAAAPLCTPYPGTGIARYAIDNGGFNGDFELIDDSYYTESVLKFSRESEKRQIENLHKLSYLACQPTTTQDRPRAAPNPTTPEIANLPAPPRAPPDLRPSGTQLDLRRPEDPKRGKIDRVEHRKGMPVRDNLLE